VHNSNVKQFAFGAVILGAGRSQRMGCPKLLLPWCQSSVLGHLIRTWRDLKARQIAVVCASDARAIQQELNRLEFPARDRIFNATPELGMFSSIQCAAEWPGWMAGLTHWIISLGDQPHLRTDTLSTLLDFAARHPAMICQPLRNGRRRHPVVMPRPIFFNLKDSPALDLRQFLAEHAADEAGFEAGDAGLDFDIDTPGDYERAQRLCLRREGRRTSRHHG
jgi:CTP:molybdopterin cytidylyltransferase MocA